METPSIWQSKLQTTIALSTTEAEYVALSTAMQDVIYFMNLIDEMKNFGITLPGVPTPITTCCIRRQRGCIGAREYSETQASNQALGRSVTPFPTVHSEQANCC